MSSERELLRMEGIVKIYGVTTVLNHVNFDVRAGEVHALAGENGAGKSTLIKILSGNVEPNEGKIFFQGKEVNIHNADTAHEAGVSTVYQELVQAPFLTVAENIYMGRIPNKAPGVIDRKKMNSMAKELMEQIHIDLDPDMRLDKLSLANRQMVEILKALSYDSRVIVFDEPTSSLTEKETVRLFEIIETLRQKGVAVIYISHRMEEIFKLTDRISVLRDGQMIRTLNTKETNENEIIELMVGRDLTNLYPKAKVEMGEEVLKVEKLTNTVVKEASFGVRKGEILGFGGLVGAGRTETMLSLIGEIPYTGSIFLNGEMTRIKNPKEAIEKGISYLTEDRKDLGLILPFEIYKNTTLSTLKEHSRYFFLKRKKERETSQGYFDRLHVLANGIDVRVKNLSGGNQQKVMIARCLASHPDVLILDEPTRGVDVGAKAEIYEIISDLARQGVAIILVSSDMPELIAMSDRVAVMCEGTITKILDKEEINEINIMKYSVR